MGALLRKLEIEVPIIQASRAGASTPEMAAPIAGIDAIVADTISGQNAYPDAKQIVKSRNECNPISKCDNSWMRFLNLR